MRITEALKIVLESVNAETGTWGQPADEPHVHAFMANPNGASTTLFFKVAGLTLRRFYGPGNVNGASLNQELRNRMEDAGFPGLPPFPSVSAGTRLLELANHVDAFGDAQGPETIRVSSGATVVVVEGGGNITVARPGGTADGGGTGT